MKKGLTAASGLPSLLIMACLVIILAGVKAASQVVVPFLLALFLAVIIYPVVRSLRKFHIPPVISVMLIITLILVGFFSVASVLATSLNDFTRSLPQYRGLIGEHLRLLQGYASQINISISSDELMKYFDPNVLVGLITRLLSSFSGMMTSIFLLLMTVVFMLLEAQSLPAKVSKVLKNPDQGMLNIQGAINSISRYLAIKTIISIMTGLIIWGFLFAIGVKYALLWGILGFLLNYIPNIGSFIAAVPPVLQALLFNGISEAIVVTGCFVVVNIIVGNMLEPRIMGRGLGLSTLVVFLSLIFWGWLLGPIGMLLSVPLTIVAKIMLEASADGKKFAIMLGDGK